MHRQPAGATQFLDRPVRPRPLRDQLVPGRAVETFDLAQAEPKRQASNFVRPERSRRALARLLCKTPFDCALRASLRTSGSWFKRAIPFAVIDVDAKDLDAMLAGIADDLGGRVESHRLRVQQRRREG